MRVVHLLDDAPETGSAVLSLVGRFLGRFAGDHLDGGGFGAGRFDLLDRDFEITVAGPPAANRSMAFTAEPGVRFVSVDIPSSDELIGAPARLAGAVRDAKLAVAGADIVHAHGHPAGLVAATAVARGVPLVVSWHDGAPETGARGAVWGAVQRVVVRRATVVLAASPELVDAARRLGARDARLAPLVMPPFHPRASAMARQQARTELGLGRGPLLLAAGEPAILLEALARLADRDPPPVLLYAGTTELGDAVGGLPVRVFRRTEISDLVIAADVAVAAGARPEAVTLVQEALQAGTPIVTLGSGGLADVAGAAALAVPAGADAADVADELAGAIGRVLDEPVLGKRLAAAGPKQAETLPDEDDRAAQVMAVYDELLRAT